MYVSARATPSNSANLNHKTETILNNSNVIAPAVVYYI